MISGFPFPLCRVCRLRAIVRGNGGVCQKCHDLADDIDRERAR